MNKKFFALVIISLVFFAGGCGGGSSSSSVTSTTDVNAALKGAWTSSKNGTASIAEKAEIEDLESLIAQLGDNLSADVDSFLEEYKNNQNTKISVPVTRVMALFEDCKVDENSGTAKFTAIIILSNDSAFLPVFFNGVNLSTQRNGLSEWTATIPDVGTLTINMFSDEEMNISGKVKYLDYDCEFSSVIKKNQSNSLNPDTILNGTWSFDGTQGGGYLAYGSQIIAAVAPETVSMFFSGAASDLSATSFYALNMRTSSSEEKDDISLLQNISDGKGKLTNIYGDVYKFQGTDGTDSIIFVENIDEIFVFMLESEDIYGQACMFLPLKKVSVDIEKALSKTWTASKGMGGGYASDFKGDEEEVALLNELGAFSFSLRDSEMKFSDVKLNDDGTVTATINMNASFLFTNEILADLIKAVPEISENDMLISMSDNGKQQVTMTRSGNFLQFSLDEDVYKLSFISDTEAFLAITPDHAHVGKGEFAIRMRASE